MAVPAEDTSFPKRIGRYELLAKIASGGMATVYLGRSLGARGFERVVAIKKLHDFLEVNAEVVADFFAEARVAARIRHPNVVPTLDVDDGDGHCLVMEYVEGDQLSGLLRAAVARGTRIPLDIALRIAVDLLSGLHAAHELTDDTGRSLRVVHRDVSPQNVLVGVDGVAKVTDFGIAKIGDTATDAQAETLKGKLSYMAPEQALRERVDRRTDVFSAGIVIWELLTTRRLFQGDTSAATLSAVLALPIPRADRDDDVPEEVATVVAKALERDPLQRWQTAAEVASALESAADAVGGLASAKRVAEHVLDVSGAKIASERERLRARVTRARPAEAPSRELLPSVEIVVTAVDDAHIVKRRSRPLPIAGMAVVLVVLVASLFLARARSHEPPSTPARAAPSVTAAPSVVATPIVETVAPSASATTRASATPPVRRPPTRAATGDAPLPRNPYRN